MRNLLPSILLLSIVACTLPGKSADDARVANLIAEGRTLLDANDPVQAQVLFERAEQLDEGLATRIWVLRSWMEQGKNNDTLDAIDELVREGNEGPAIDYLYGMAFVLRAEEYIALGVTDTTISMNFQDAASLLKTAVEAEPERFHDAYVPLATAAWMTQDLPTAREAAETAVREYDRSGDAALLLGQIALSQFQVAHTASAWSAEAAAHWDAALHAFQMAIARYGTPADEEAEVQLAQAYVQVGHTLLWKERKDEAVDAYVGAIAAAPDACDFSQLQSLLDAESFNRALENGERAFLAGHPDPGARDAALLWWLGWSRYALEQHEPAAEAFLASVEKSPAYVNAYFFAALAKYGAARYGEAVDLLEAGWQADPGTIVASMQREEELNLAKVAYLVGWCVETERLDDAALLSLVSAETAGDEPVYWNNRGFFLRDYAVALDGEDAVYISPEALALLEESYAAYSRALELDPHNPQLLNDTAVMLHYYLQRDQDRALEMYAEARERAEALLAAGELSEEMVPVVETALEDATNNARRLKEHRAQAREANGARPVDADGAPAAPDDPEDDARAEEAASDS